MPSSGERVGYCPLMQLISKLTIAAVTATAVLFAIAIVQHVNTTNFAAQCGFIIPHARASCICTCAVGKNFEINFQSGSNSSSMAKSVG